MVLCEVIGRLVEDGFSATPDKVRHAVETGQVTRPPKNGRGDFIYHHSHLKEIKRYLRTARPGRPSVRRER